MEEECEVEKMFAQVPSIDLDPGQVNLLLSSLNPVVSSRYETEEGVEVIDGPESSDCLSETTSDAVKNRWSSSVPEETRTGLVLSVSPLFSPTPPPLTSNFRVNHCSKCDFFSLSSEACSKHEALDHAAPRPTIQCISCPNIFLSLQALKVHLLLDHEVLKNELQSILLLTLRKCDEFLLSSNSAGSNKKSTDIQEVRDENIPIFVPDSPSPTNFIDPKLVSSSLSQNKSGSEVRRNTESTTRETSVTVSHSDATTDGQNEKSSCQNPSSKSDSVISQSVNFLSERNLEKAEQELLQSDDLATQNQMSIGSTRDSESTYTDDDDDDDIFSDSTSDDSDDARHRRTMEGNDECITKHLQLMEQLKKEKLKANRCHLDGCRLRFQSYNTMEYHKKCHGKSGWKCPECSRVFVTWHSLSVHLWNEHTIDMELYYCNICSFRTPNLSHLRTSHIWIHGKGKMFTCSTCSKAFKTKKQLRNHQAIHKKSVVRYECEQCKALFSKCHLLRQHYDAVHQRTRRFRCNACGHRSASRSAHILHIRTHTKEKKYACSECSYWTGDHNALRRHTATHSGIRPYNCPHCTYVSISSTCLLSHVNSKHPGMLGDVVFSCPLCPFKTLRKEIFLAHASKHNFTSPTALKQVQLGLNTPDESSHEK